MITTHLSRRQTLGLFFGAALRGGDTLHAGPAFHYQAIFSREAEEWYTRFPILVTGNILSDKQSRSLRVNKTRLVAYTWSSAFYPGDEVSALSEWQSVVVKRRSEWLLNRSPLGGAAAASGRVAEWYDFGNPELVSALASHLATRLSAAGYDGFFLDTLGSEHVPEAAMKEFRSRHPHVDYDTAQGGLLRELRQRLRPGSLIFANQGYRHAAAFLPHADLDLTESYFTAIDGSGGTMIRNWHDSRTPWDAVKVPMERLVLPAARTYPRVRFVHLNYAAGNASAIRRAVSYSYACAKLFGHDAYLVSPGEETGERDQIYFSELGQPVSKAYQEAEDGTVVWREYQKGIVAINTGRGPAVLSAHSLKLPEPQRGYVFR